MLSTCGELELPIILHRLVEYLGHPNALICGIAYREVRFQYTIGLRARLTGPA